MKAERVYPQGQLVIRAYRHHKCHPSHETSFMSQSEALQRNISALMDWTMYYMVGHAFRMKMFSLGVREAVHLGIAGAFILRKGCSSFKSIIIGHLTLETHNKECKLKHFC